MQAIKIIVADCHTDYIEVFIKLLRNSGFNVVGQVPNGAQLIEAINPGNMPDIVVIQYKTSKPETLNAAIWIKKNYPVIKVVINTQFNNNIPFEEIKRLGIEGIIIKANHDEKKIIEILHSVYNGKVCYAENCPRL
jgi:DNA-binding NarL/FixJ family response regulator